MTTFECDAMIMDLEKDPSGFTPPSFPLTHPSHQMRIEEVRNRATAADYAKLVHHAFVHLELTEDILNETIESYLRIKRDEDPKYISFVGYEFVLFAISSKNQPTTDNFDSKTQRLYPSCHGNGCTAQRDWNGMHHRDCIRRVV
jgi:hypothetical protein